MSYTIFMVCLLSYLFFVLRNENRTYNKLVKGMNEDITRIHFIMVLNKLELFGGRYV